MRIGQSYPRRGRISGQNLDSRRPFPLCLEASALCYARLRGTRTPGGVAMAASEKAPKPADDALVAGGAEPTPDRSKWTWAARHRVSAVALALLAVGILAAAVAVYQHWAGDAKNIVRIELSGKPITVPAKPDTIDALVGGQGGLYRHALIYDAALIAGYLVAITLACSVVAQLASTAFGRRVF